jgi:hypothetical protein
MADAAIDRVIAAESRVRTVVVDDRMRNSWVINEYG